ncbi:MAG: RnfABCDGE type electron transport complex subunit D, partial [Oligoflexia bacterium]|nr:RnfABCDGE type electron transport complex subunit D [Oligoflexia bacterium]
GWSVYVFGLPALKVIILCVVACVALEYAVQKIFKMRLSYLDGSAVVTGILLAMNLPSSAPVWLCVAGSFIAIVIAKMAFGGLGNNIFNPALVARVALLISFPVQMTHWPKPFEGDAITSATPLGLLGTEGVSGVQNISLYDLFMGNIGGSLGEVSVLCLLLGAALLFYKKYIRWDVPFSFIAGLSVFIFIVNMISPGKTAGIPFHLFSGGLVLGAFFMATDMVTSPLTTRGRLIFGLGCGIISGLIRVFGSFPEGVSFSILLMNALTPTIDKYIQPRVYGTRKGRPSA